MNMRSIGQNPPNEILRSIHIQDPGTETRHEPLYKGTPKIFPKEIDGEGSG